MGCKFSRIDTNGEINIENKNSQNQGKRSEKQKKYQNNINLRVTHDQFIQKKDNKITDDYKITKDILGKGGFGEVRKGVHKASGTVRAIKYIQKDCLDEEEKETLINEVEILKQIDHPNIIKIYEFYEDNKYFYIVSELCTGGELFDRIVEKGSFNEQEAANLMKQIMGAIYYCHTNKIAHRDLKPENILYETSKTNSQIRVIDFGTSKKYQHNEKMHAKFGTPYYIAPEVLGGKYDEKCDIWSCGVILFILMCGNPPFNAETDEEILELAKIGKYEFNNKEWDNVSSDCKDLIRCMLTKDPVKRYSAEQVVNHQWIKQKASEQKINEAKAVNALKNLKNFRDNNKLQNAIWTFVVSQLASIEEKSSLLDIFKALDVNGDGQLTREELLNGYHKIMGEGENVEELVNEIMNSVDSNNSGKIDYSEFVMASLNRNKVLSKERLKKAFSMFDKDNSGTISINELKQIFDNGLDEQMWQQLLQECNVITNGKGEVTFKEFEELMNKYL